MAAVITNAGAALVATQIAGGNPLMITSIVIGTLTPSQRYDAVVTQTALVDSTPAKTITTNIDISAIGNELGINLFDNSSDAYTASEIGYFSNSTLVFVDAVQASDLFVKAADTVARASLTATISGLTITNVNVSIPDTLPATQAMVTTGTDNTTYVTPLTLRGEMDYTQKYPHRTGLAETFDSMRQQGVWNVRNPGGRSDGPTAAGNNDSKLEVVHTQYPTFGRLDIIQELSTSAGAIFTREGTIQGTAGTTPDWDGNPLPTATWQAWARTGLPVATNAQIDENDVDTATDAAAVSPKGLLRKLGSFIRNATTTARGMVELADNTEALAGSDNERAMTPATTKALVDDRISGKITISDSAPQSSDGSDGDIWLEY